jgi:hypothetical protein
MILSKNRSPNVQTRMIGTQHITEAEAVPGMEVAATRIPPGAVILRASMEVVEAMSAGTIGTTFVNGDGVTADVILVAAATDATAVAITAGDTNLPLRAPQGGWVCFTPALTVVTEAGGDVLSTVEYMVDGRWTEVMSEGTPLADVAA